jgi:NTE family protein
MRILFGPSPIPTLGIRSTEFGLSRQRSEELYQSGRRAAKGFITTWDFERYKVEYRRTTPPGRRERLRGSAA